MVQFGIVIILLHCLISELLCSKFRDLKTIRGFYFALFVIFNFGVKIIKLYFLSGSGKNIVYIGFVSVCVCFSVCGWDFVTFTVQFIKVANRLSDLIREAHVK